MTKPIIWWEGNWKYHVEPAYIFLFKRAKRQAWKPRTSKSRYQKRWDRRTRKMKAATQGIIERWAEKDLYRPNPLFQTIKFTDVPIVYDPPNQ